ncbi:hypothetical protein UNDYM_2283 [Undibacterium sp. YM2]|nr:hypothetical protein UNDYM_2283 [Undibacterium sp. YM2]
MTNTSDRTVRRGIGELVSYSLISKQQKGNTKSNDYTINTALIISGAVPVLNAEKPAKTVRNTSGLLKGNAAPTAKAVDAEMGHVYLDVPDDGHVVGASWATIDVKLDKQPSVAESFTWDGWDDEEDDIKPRNRNPLQSGKKFEGKEDWELREGGSPFD